LALQKGEKWKNKKWFNIYSPKVLGESIIGEMPANDEKNVLGRVIKVSLSWITQNPQHSFMNVGLRVVDASENAVHTKIDYIEGNYSYLHSLVRRYSTAIYTVDKLKDKEGNDVVLKLIAVTANRVATPKKKGIRAELIKFGREYVGSMGSEDLVKSIIEGNLQAEGRRRANKIAPISKLEVKRIEF
jgi:ribosomal protein S3AE